MIVDIIMCEYEPDRPHSLLLLLLDITGACSLPASVGANIAKREEWDKPNVQSEVQIKLLFQY
ncbi:MAG: hypothetical protein HW386_2020 [Gammaproteobacteria bacterium]|nr:hypothetical protein [Gammaproteobacteria bacterium]